MTRIPRIVTNGIESVLIRLPRRARARRVKSVSGFCWTNFLAGRKVEIVKRPHTAIVVGAILVVAVVLTLYCCRIGFQSLSPEDSSLVRVAQAEKVAFKSYRRGTNAQGTQALLSLTKLLENEEARWQNTSNGRVFANDLGLTYGRLALLAGAIGETDKKNEYDGHAWLWFKKSGCVFGSEQEIRTFVLRADESGDRGEALDSNERTNGIP